MFNVESLKTLLRRVPRPLLVAITGFADSDGFVPTGEE